MASAQRRRRAAAVVAKRRADPAADLRYMRKRIGAGLRGGLGQRGRRGRVAEMIEKTTERRRVIVVGRSAQDRADP